MFTPGEITNSKMQRGPSAYEEYLLKNQIAEGIYQLCSHEDAPDPEEVGLLFQKATREHVNFNPMVKQL
jgi:hypothetical protein